MPTRRALILCALLSVLLAVLAGCGRGSAANPVTQEPTDVFALAKKSARPADLSAPFNMLVWSQTGASHAPLTVAAQLASSAGGDWIAILPKPVDDLSWQPQFPGRYPGGMVIVRRPGGEVEAKQDDSISACLTAIQKAGDKIAWDNHDGRITVYFGPDEQLGHARAHPPDTVTGVYLRAHNCAGMLASIADFWKVKIDVDPALLARRDALIGTRKEQEDQDEPRGMMGALSRMYRSGAMMGRMARPAADALTLQVDEKITPEALLQRVAAMMGGECVRQGGGWRIAGITDQTKLQAEVTKLKQTITEKAGSEYVHSSPNPMSGEPTIVIGTPSDEAQQAIGSLVALGPSTLPALQEYLTAEKASLARTVLRDLVAVATPEARKAVLSFGQKLLGDTSVAGKAQSARPLLLGEIVRALAAKPTEEGAVWLAQAARDSRVPSDLRMRARMALAGSGRLALLQSSSRPAASYHLSDFALSAGPDGKASAAPGSSVLTVVSTCKAKDGSTWAVFLSGRCGDPSDFWLAHGTGSKWTEFLFTGKTFPRENMQYQPWGSKPPGPDSLSVKLEGEKVTLGPPAGQAEDPEIAKLQKQMNDPKLPTAKRRRIAQQLGMRQSMQWQRRMNQLQETITVDLAGIRQDSDRDGLTDLVEKRLGTNAAKADTDGDGVTDGVDPNPLVPRRANFTDRQRLIQAVFTALYGGDPNTDPIVVVLDKRDWMEFPGASAPVYCLTREEYLQKLSSLNSFRVLQFGGLGSAGSTILSVDGPVAYNDTRTRAEIHFWQWGSRVSMANPWMALYAAQGSSTPVDYVALFQRRGDAWKMESLKPWLADTADTAMGDLMRKQMESGMMQ